MIRQRTRSDREFPDIGQLMGRHLRWERTPMLVDDARGNCDHHVTGISLGNGIDVIVVSIANITKCASDFEQDLWRSRTRIKHQSNVERLKDFTANDIYSQLEYITGISEQECLLGGRIYGLNAHAPAAEKLYTRATT